MSFPNIPDINPCINLKMEDAIALLLASIAFEEFSLSGLIDAETNKIKLLVDECGCGEASVQDLKDINRSVDHTLKDISKLQMLLQYKLENVIEIICPTSTTTSTSSTTTTTSTSSSTTTTTKTTTSSSTTTSTCSMTTTSKTTTSTSTSTSTTTKTTTSSSTTTSTCSMTTTSKTTTSTSTSTSTTTKTTTSSSTTTSTCSMTTTSKTTTSTSTSTSTTTKSKTTTSTSTTSCTTTKKKCSGCSLTGRSQGIVSNCKDYFFGGTAILQPCVCNHCSNIKNSLLCYSVHRGAVLVCFNAFPESLTIKCPTVQCPNKLVIKGYGSIIKKHNFCKDISDTGRFVLTVWDEGAWTEVDSFHMIIKSLGNPELNHDSGIINAKGSGMVIGICPDPLVFLT